MAVPIAIPCKVLVCSYAAPNAKSKAEHEVFNLGFVRRKKMVLRSAFETLVRLAVVEQIADAVHRVFENRSSGKSDHSDFWIHEWDDVESRYEASVGQRGFPILGSCQCCAVKNETPSPDFPKEGAFRLAGTIRTLPS
jgi:hypothetical protein